MRIAMSSYRFDQQGGIERASYEVASGLAARGHEVTLLAHAVDPPPAPPLRWQRVTLPPHPRLVVPALYPRAASRQLDRTGVDLTHNQGGCALLGQDVLTAHSCHRAWWELKRLHGETARALLNPRHHEVLQVERLNYRPGAYQHVIAVSSGLKAELQHHYGIPDDRVTVVPNGVDLARFRPPDRAAVRAEVRARHGYAPDDLVLLFVGKEFRRKGLAPAVDALAGLPEHVRLLVVGGDDPAPYAARARAHGVRHRVTWVGHSARVEDYFSAADLFVLPTLYESFGLVAIEAAAAGVPVVTTRVSGIEEYVVDGVNGRFVERDGASVAAVVADLAADPDRRASMGRAALASAQAYTWEAAVDGTLAVYERVLAERRRAGRR